MAIRVYCQPMAYSRIAESGGEFSLSFRCGELPADAVVTAAGHNPNGYFWEGIATLIAPDLVEHLQMDSDPDEFRAVGLRADLEELRTKLEAVISRPDMIRVLLQQATTEGFDFHD